LSPASKVLFTEVSLSMFGLCLFFLIQQSGPVSAEHRSKSLSETPCQICLCHVIQGAEAQK
jgi:hypothetical protein